MGSVKCSKKDGTNWREEPYLFDRTIWVDFFAPASPVLAFSFVVGESNVVEQGAEQLMVVTRRAFPTLLFVLLLSTALLCQSTNASLTGRITDPKKAIITDATVTVINTGTGVRYQGLTNETGDILRFQPASRKISH